MLIGFAVGNHEEPVAVEAGLHENAQPLGGPVGVGQLAQARFLFGRGTGGDQAGRQMPHLTGQRLEFSRLEDSRISRRRSRPQRPKPLRQAEQRPAETPADGQQGDSADQESLNSDADQCPAPQCSGLDVDIGGVVEYGKNADHRRIVPQRQGDNVHGIAAQLHETRMGQAVA